MTVTANVTKNGNNKATVSGRFTLKGLPTFDKAEASKPLYAVVGVADLAIEQAKDVPTLVKDLPNQVEARVSTATDRAGDLYAKLTVRGKRLVTQIRRQPSTQVAVAEGKQAVRKASTSATAARKSAKAGEKAVEDAASKIG
jgi:hypothetical protein